MNRFSRLAVKLLIFIALALPLIPVYAQIYKCETVQGKTIYQDLACKNPSNQRDVKLHKFDPEKTIEAQEKLRKELLQHQKLKNIKAEQALKERQIKALEAQARSNEDLAKAADKNTYAVERNTAAKLRNRNSSHYLYKYKHLGYRSGHIKPIINRHKQRNITKRDKATKLTVVP